MSKSNSWRNRVQGLADRTWEVESIRNRLNNLRQKGFGPKYLDWMALQDSRKEVLDRVQRRAEEYEYLTHSCSKGSALALMEEFGLGNMPVIKALNTFPGIGGTGEMGGGVTGSLMAFGLYFGSDDQLDFQANGPTMITAQKFMAFFEDQVGYLVCSDIQEKVIFGRNMDPGASEENMEAFAKARGFEKCGLAPGLGARLAAEFIIESLE